MFENIPEDYKESPLYHLGYRTAEREIKVFMKPLSECLEKKFEYALHISTMSPNNDLLVMVTFILETLLDIREIHHSLYPILDNRWQNPTFNSIKQQFEESSSGSQKIADPYWALLSDIKTARKETENAEQEIERIKEESKRLDNLRNIETNALNERIETLKQLILQLQTELDDVNNTRQ